MKKFLAIICSILILFSTSVNVAVAAGTEGTDSNGPVLESYEILETIQTGETWTIKAKFANSSEVNGGFVYLYSSESNQIRTLNLFYNDVEDVWEASYTFLKSDHPGLWAIEVDVWGIYENRSRINLDSLTHINEDPDLEGPIIESTYVSTNTASIGDEIQFAVKAYDEISEMGSITVDLYSKEHWIGKTIDLEYDEDTDTWIGSYEVYYDDEAGIYGVSIVAYDNVGNPTFLEFFETIEFIIADKDTEDPIIDKVEVSPKVVTPGEEVTVKVYATDATSGVSEVDVYHDFYENDRMNMIPMSYDNVEQAWIGTYVVGENDRLGDVSLRISVMDFVYNSAFEFIETAFTIVETKGVEEPTEEPSPEKQQPVETKPVIENGTAKVSSDVIESVKTGEVLVVNLEKADSAKVVLTKEQMKTLKEKGAGLVVENHNVQLQIPLNNLPQDKTIETVVQKMETVDGAVSQVYDFTIYADGQAVHKFETPITLVFEVDTEQVTNPDNLKVFYYNEKTEEWELVPGAVYQDGKVSVGTSHFSIFAVFEVATNEVVTKKPVVENKLPETTPVTSPSGKNDKTTDEAKSGKTDTKISEEVSEAADSGADNKLPVTATNNYTLLLGGIILLALGAVLVFSRRKFASR